MGTEKKLRVLYVDLQAAEEDRVSHWAELKCIYETSKPTSIVKHFLFKATPIPTKLYLLIVPLPIASIQTRESMGVIPTLTTTTNVSLSS